MHKLLQTNDAINLLEELAQLVMVRSSDLVLLRRANDAINAIEQHDIAHGEEENERERVANDNDDFDADETMIGAEDYDNRYGEYNE